MNSTERRPRTIGVVAVVSVAVLVAVVVLATGSRGSDDVVGRVDGHPVTRAELAFYMSMSMRSVQNEIQVAAEPPASWNWEQPVDGVPARHHLQDAAWERLVRDKQVFILAEELGIIDYVDHAGFLDAHAAENTSRSQAVARGEIVYGTVTFTPSQYYATVLAELETQVARALAGDPDDPLHVSAADVEARYAAEPDQWSANVTEYECLRLSVAATGTGEEGAAQAEALRSALATAASLSQVAEEIDGAELAGERIDGSEQLSLRGPDREVLAQLADLDVGERTTPIEREGRLIVYELTGIEVDAAAALDAYGERIRQTILVEKYDDLISANVRDSDVDIDDRALRTITMEELAQ